MRFVIKRDGTRIRMAPVYVPPPPRTFEQTRDAADAALLKLGLGPDVLMRMHRRITLRGQRYKPFGA
jgi:hypothetical protein